MKKKKCKPGMCLMIPSDSKLGSNGPYNCAMCGKKSPGFMGIKRPRR